MSNEVIKLENISKRYLLGHRRNAHDGLRHRLEDMLRNPFHWFRNRLQNSKSQKEEFWALKEVSFGVNQGEVVGIIGRNGAGKSTLLKILSRITEPTAGRVRLKGRVASLLEVGTGFHAELTGRENIYLNGAILGMKKIEIRRKFDEIVAFSEVEGFLDTPVKRYSSGMYVRLAFAVAAHLEPEILLVDEVLAVGDAAFQKKCLGKMGEVSRGGRTILFVSHNMEAVRTLCQRVILIEGGKIGAEGNMESVLETYFARLATGYSRHRRSSYGLVIKRVVFKNDRGQETQEFCPGEDLVVEMIFDVQRRVEKPYFILVVESSRGTCFAANMLLDGHRPKSLEGEGVISCRFKALPLLPQRYTIKLQIRDSNGRDLILDDEILGSFTLAANLEDYGFTGEFLSLVSVSTPVVVPYEWQMPDGTNNSVALRAPESAV